MDDYQKYLDATNKWLKYENEYILPCFDLALTAGIDLRKLVRDNPGKNCVILLVEELTKMYFEACKRCPPPITQLQLNRKPAFSCAKCGAAEYLYGAFSAAALEQQKEKFDAIHARCLPIVDGGLI